MTIPKNLILLILGVTLVCSVGSSVASGTSGKGRLLSDGFILNGIEGKLSTNNRGSSQSAKWFFKLDSGLSDGKGRIRTGESLELLPSAALEKMAADISNRSEASYRLWARVTQYKGKNFLFPIYFLPLSKTKRSESSSLQQSRQKQPSPIIDDPNDILAIPEEILSKLKKRKIIRTEQLQKGMKLKADSILAGRIGFVRDSKSQAQLAEYKVFVLDGLGRGIQQVSFSLLPSQVLESVERVQLNEAEPLRFKVAGIVTEFKETKYLLLQKATRVYSHGNFSR